MGCASHPDPDATTGEADAWRAGAQWGMRQPRFPGEWQPIETAPRDEVVLIHYGAPAPAVAVLSADGQWIVHYPHWAAWEAQPTHWMSLPPPP
jgi:hypothetical protein